MNNVVPPVIEQPKTVIGIGGREMVVLGVAVFLVLLIVITPAPMLVKVGFGVLVGGLGVVLAFGRDHESGKTAEAYLLKILHFRKRSRFHQRGASVEVVNPAPVSVDTEICSSPSGEGSKPLLTIRPLPLSGGLFFGVFSLAFLATLLAWLWLGGYQEMSLYVKPLF